MPVKPSKRLSPRERTANRLPEYPVGVYPVTDSGNVERPEEAVEPQGAFSRTSFLSDLRKVSRPLAERDGEEDDDDVRDARTALDEAREKGTTRWKKLKGELGL